MQDVLLPNDGARRPEINKDNAFRIFTRMWLDKGNVKIKTKACTEFNRDKKMN